MEYICMICGRKTHVLREGKVMLCTRCITALGLALNDKIHPPAEENNEQTSQATSPGTWQCSGHHVVQGSQACRG